MIKQLEAHPGVVTSVMLQCNVVAAANGSIIGSLGPLCEQVIPELRSLNVLPEIWLGSEAGDAASFHLLWNNNVTAVEQLTEMAVQYNISGWNIDLEPNSDPSTTTADAQAYAAWLTALKASLHPHGVRLTVDVATWSTMIADFSVLAPSVDRLMNMETYNADSLSQWMRYYQSIVNDQIDRNVVGIGLGCWVDSSTNGTWSVTPESAAQRIAQIKLDNVPEIDMFRLLPITGPPSSPWALRDTLAGGNPPQWPEEFWWDALVAYKEQFSQ
jgi:hypothetical protein